MTNDNNVGLVPLGGFGEIGMNCLAIEAEARILVVDCGVMFPSPEELGVDVIHPSFDHLVAKRDRIDGVIITHGHEDHAAGVPYLLREIDVPVYGGPYALALVERRVRGAGARGRFVPRPVPAGGAVEIGPFRVRTFPMPHSIAENTGLLVEAGGMRLLHTGDFKLDMRGPDGGLRSIDLLRELAAPGVDLLICDSTGAEEAEPAGGEAAVEAHLAELVANAEGAVFAAIFSSNTVRMNSLFRAAQLSGRRVALAGRSVETHAEIAAARGLVSMPREILAPLEDVASVRREKLLVVVAGTQGEERSALRRIARGEHRQLRVEPGDLVLLSSRFIPGNEIAISRMIDELLRAGARVLHRANDPSIHVSGHGSSREIEAVIGAVKPRGFLAAHGTLRHTTAAAQIARSAGVERSFAISNGDLLRVAASGVFVESGFAPSGRVMIDGDRAVPESAMRERRLLGSHGFFNAAWVAGPDGSPLGEIEISTKGVIADEALPWLAAEVRGKIRELLSEMDPEVRSAPTACREAVRPALRRFIERTTGLEPYVLVTILS